MGTPRHAARGGGVWRIRVARATTVALVLGALLGGLAQPAAADDPLGEALKRKQELERAVQVSRANTARYQAAASQFQAVVTQTNARIADLAAKQDAAQSEADQLFYQIQIAEEQLALVTFQLDETRALVDSLKAQSTEETKQLATREDLYARHLRTTYRQALVSPLEMLLSSSSLTEFANRLQAMIFINRQDVQLANDIRALRADTQRKQDDASAKEKEILGLQEQVSVTRQRLAAEKAVYDKLVAEADAAIDEQAAARAGAAANRQNAQGQAVQSKVQTTVLQRQLDEAEARYEMLAAAAAGGCGCGAFTGSKLAMWPLTGPITSPFGPRWGGFHNGIDIAAPMYTPIRAASLGKVVTVGRPYIAYGDTAVVVIIAHGDNFSTLYGHLADGARWPIVSVGQIVSAGQIIGYVGMTGFTTGPHLHFMTIMNGRAVNPRIYLP
ncbi:MAG TPA: peptidoglycan DD-metalloendopeptidase family protein [Candidatus Limnocylindria bacterium]|jgi:murein DD-endopeptidase MepM/ murein hydrolase activator NlpD|nr:peptidoglycan DD-metalloendopeptidase family protein [Candidatus Limnocylindria bacterium]